MPGTIMCRRSGRRGSTGRTRGKAMSEYAVELRGVSKYFGDLAANKNITLQIRPGEVHALLGENGAGKSTLMNILFGLVQPDEGEIYRNGRKVVIRDPHEATALGIGMVHQHFNQIQCFTVLDNIILGAETMKGPVLDRTVSRRKVMDLSQKYGLQVDPDAVIGDITVGMQQRVEILKMLYRDSEVLIFDEPTAVLTVQEAEELLAIMRGLRAEGKAVLFISHKMNEILSVADRCSVIRQGEYVGTVDASAVTAEQLSEMMVGRKVDLTIKKGSSVPGEDVLKLSAVSYTDPATGKRKNRNIRLTVRKGEIVTIAGIDGNGQDELVNIVSGKTQPETGSVTFLGQDITRSSVRERIDRGMGLIPVDRLRDAVVPEFSLSDNLIQKRYREERFSGKNGVMQADAVREYAGKITELYDVRSADGIFSRFDSLSGGNQQKAVIGRELDRDPSLIVAVQPVRGVDILATNSIYNTLLREREKGKAILLVSLELSEVMSLSDRILVMYEGEIVGEFTPDNVTREELGLYMTGARRAAT